MNCVSGKPPAATSLRHLKKSASVSPDSFIWLLFIPFLTLNLDERYHYADKERRKRGIIDIIDVISY